MQLLNKMVIGGLAGLKKFQVNCQESSRDQLLESLKITLEEALEFNRQDAINAANGNYQEEKIAV